MMTDTEWQLLRAIKDMLLAFYSSGGEGAKYQGKIREAFDAAELERKLAKQAAHDTAEFVSKRSKTP